jgi:hypothetical protein
VSGNLACGDVPVGGQHDLTYTITNSGNAAPTVYGHHHLGERRPHQRLEHRGHLGQRHRCERAAQLVWQLQSRAV